MGFHFFCKAEVDGSFVYVSKQALIWELMRQYALVTGDWECGEGVVSIRPKDARGFLRDLLATMGEDGLHLTRKDFETAIDAGNPHAVNVEFHAREADFKAPDTVVDSIHKPLKGKDAK